MVNFQVMLLTFTLLFLASGIMHQSINEHATDPDSSLLDILPGTGSRKTTDITSDASTMRIFKHKYSHKSVDLENALRTDEPNLMDVFTFVDDNPSIQPYKAIASKESCNVVNDLVNEIICESFNEWLIGTIISAVEEECLIDVSTEHNSLDEGCYNVIHDQDIEKKDIAIEKHQPKVFPCLYMCSHCYDNYFEEEQILSHYCSGFYRNCLKFCIECNTQLLSASQFKAHVADRHVESAILEVRLSRKTNSEHRLDDTQMPKRVRLEPVSALVCSSQCQSQKCATIPIEILSEIETRLKKLSKSEIHQFLLKRLEDQQELGLSTDCCFIINKHTLCHGALRAIGVSKYMLEKVSSEFKAGKVNFVHGNKGVFYEKRKRDIMISYTHQFAQTMAENLPDKDVLRLPSYLNIKEIYVNYKENTNVEDQVTEKSFYYIFKQTFGDSNRLLACSLPRIVFMPRHTHPVCNDCDKINSLRQSAKTIPEKLHAESMKKRHMLDVRRKYLNFTYRRELSVRYPHDYLHIGIDDIGQDNVLSPHPRVNTKSLTGLLRLNNHVTGVIVTNGRLSHNKEYMCYVNQDQFPNDSNKVKSIMSAGISYYNLIMFLDNFCYFRRLKTCTEHSG